MTITVRPSDIYRGIPKNDIRQFLSEQGYQIAAFKMVDPGDTTLFYASKKLSIGPAKVDNAGYPRFVLRPTDGTNVDTFWE